MLSQQGQPVKFSMFDHLPIGVCVLQSDYRVLYWNRCLAEWTGIPGSKILGQPISQFFPHFQKSLYANRLELVFKSGLPTFFSSQLHPHLFPAPLSPQVQGGPVSSENQRRQSAWRVQQTTVTALPREASVAVPGSQDGQHPNREISGDSSWEFPCWDALFSVQDVTELTHQVHAYRQMRDQALVEAQARQQAQEIAEASNQAKDNFLAVISHELRSPLNPILGWSKLLRRGHLNPSLCDQALETIERNAELQSQLIEDLLDISRILRGKLTLNLSWLNLTAIIRSALSTVELAAQAKSITLHLQLSDQPLQIRGDAARLQQIIWNLLSNAVKFTPEGGRVEVCLEPSALPSPLALITVTDTGKGIHPNFLPYVFESFRQEDSTTTRSFGGLGLGLSIVRQLVELHGGTITATSPGEGLGASFQVCLPLGQPSPTSPAPAPQTANISDGAGVVIPEFGAEASPGPLSNTCILVVDDEEDSRNYIAFVLEQAGGCVIQADSAAAALAILEQTQPELLLSDVGMPQQDGYELLQEIRTRLPKFQSLPAIALTAYAGEIDQRRALSAGFARHLAKPVAPEQLLAAVLELQATIRPSSTSASSTSAGSASTGSASAGSASIRTTRLA